MSPMQTAPVRARRALLAAALLAPTLAAAQTGTPAATPAPPLTVPITFSGEVRSRSEWDRPGGAVAADAFTYLRSRFAARVDAGHGAALFLQLQDSRVLGAEGNATPTAPDVFDLHQGWVELAGTLGGIRAGARAGRQELAVGNERLVGAANWTNTGRAFDGVRLTAAPRTARAGAEPWTVALFAATVEERGRRFGATTATAATTSPAPDHATAGLYATRSLGTAALDATILHDAGGRSRSYDHADRTTFDARLRAARVLGLRAEVEGAYQTGAQRYTGTAARDQQVRAWLLAARLGTPTTPAARSGLTVGADVLSGDASPTDGTYGAFNTMYATNHPYYGLMDLFLDPAARTHDHGLVDVLATGTHTLSPDVTLRAELHRFAQATGADRPIGWEADVVAPVRVGPNATIETGYTAFRAGRGAGALGLGPDGTFRNWAYVQLRAGF